MYYRLRSTSAKHATLREMLFGKRAAPGYEYFAYLFYNELHLFGRYTRTFRTRAFAVQKSAHHVVVQEERVQKLRSIQHFVYRRFAVAVSDHLGNFV